jgi:hypothetical protein
VIAPKISLSARPTADRCFTVAYKNYLRNSLLAKQQVNNPPLNAIIFYLAKLFVRFWFLFAPFVHRRQSFLTFGIVAVREIHYQSPRVLSPRHRHTNEAETARLS